MAAALAAKFAAEEANPRTPAAPSAVPAASASSAVKISGATEIAPATGTKAERLAAMREQVNRARAVQRQRFGPAGQRLNSHMATRQLRKHCKLEDDSRDLLKTAMEELGLSARAHDRILRVARTVADLEGSADIQEPHLNEAISYRSLDRKLWTR